MVCSLPPCPSRQLKSNHNQVNLLEIYPCIWFFEAKYEKAGVDEIERSYKWYQDHIHKEWNSQLLILHCQKTSKLEKRVKIVRLYQSDILHWNVIVTLRPTHNRLLLLTWKFYLKAEWISQERDLRTWIC